MGWTEGDDTLTQIELSFPSMASAIAYAERQGLTYTVQGAVERAANLGVVARTSDAERAAAAARRERLEWVEATLGRDVIQRGLRSRH